MTGYDIDGVLTTGKFVLSSSDVVISGRTHAEYDNTCKQLASVCPVYIRGVGKFGDREHAGRFKAFIINMLGVTTFYEDDIAQIKLIQETCPNCKVMHV